jgi:hypothetical protein
MEVETEERFGENVHVLEVDHPDLLSLWIVQKVVEGDIRETQDTFLAFELDSVLTSSSSGSTT